MTVSFRLEKILLFYVFHFTPSYAMKMSFRMADC